jgi:hypothetical protein
MATNLFSVCLWLTFIYCIYRFRTNVLYLLIILIFYDGLFAYYGDQIWNAYKTIIPILTIYCASKYKAFTNFEKEDYIVFGTFLLFSFSFMLSAYLNGDYFTITFSQFSKYFDVFLLFFIFKRISTHSGYHFEKIINLMYTLLIIQILLTLIKFSVYGFYESIVGSISFTGGAAASILPILGFIFIWFMRKGALKRNDWILTLLLMFIGVVSMKRAIWFIMPLIILLFLYYVPRKRIPKNFFYALPLIPIAFYFAVRMNPTFNKESSKWGSFNLSYVLESSREYTFGSKDSNEKGQGRGGAVILLLDNLFHKEPNIRTLFGFGLRDMYATDYDQFDELGFGLNHKGSATGLFQSYVSTGYVGMFLTMLFIFTILKTIREKRLRTVLTLLFCWEYIFYTGSIIRNPAIAILLVFIISYANTSFNPKPVQFNPIPNKLA